MSVVKIRRNAGFSLIELIAVIILLGILGVVALGRFGGGDGIAARGFFDDTVSAVQFAQKFAISSGCDTRVVIQNSGYTVRQRSDCTTDDFSLVIDNPANRADPGGYSNTDIPDGFQLSPTGVITFDARGRREEATSSFDFSDGSTTFRFRVHGDSGLVEVL